MQACQFGFRPRKSIAQAIFIARRLMDIAERAGTNLTLVLLDWKVAFDKVNHTKLLQVLRRLRVPPRLFQAILHIYICICANPQFRVSTGSTHSSSLTQNAGIRQGCPLSPYLFILLMSAIFSDIKERMSTPKHREPIPGVQNSQVLYADDTLVFRTYMKHINILIREIQQESHYYNMELNLDKCINLTVNRTQSSIKYSDGTLLPRKQAARYFGTLLTGATDNRQEHLNRIADATRTCNRLKLFWNKEQTSIVWKMRVFQAII